MRSSFPNVSPGKRTTSTVSYQLHRVQPFSFIVSRYTHAETQEYTWASGENAVLIRTGIHPKERGVHLVTKFLLDESPRISPEKIFSSYYGYEVPTNNSVFFVKKEIWKSPSSHSKIHFPPHCTFQVSNPHAFHARSRTL